MSAQPEAPTGEALGPGKGAAATSASSTSYTLRQHAPQSPCVLVHLGDSSE
jgi:hypothetical protein